MGLIVDVRIPAHRFGFGRRLPVSDGTGAESELVGTVGDGDVSIFSLSGSLPNRQDGGIEDSFVDVEGYRLEVVEPFDGRELY